MNRETGKEKVNQDYSRREFIKATAFTVGAAGALSICGLAPAQAAGKSNELSLSVAGYKFDRTEALIDGRVKVEGCNIKFQQSGIGDMNTNVFSGPQSYDVTEIGLHSFILAYANDAKNPRTRSATLLACPLKIISILGSAQKMRLSTRSILNQSIPSTLVK